MNETTQVPELQVQQEKNSPKLSADCDQAVLLARLMRELIKTPIAANQDTHNNHKWHNRRWLM